MSSLLSQELGAASAFRYMEIMSDLTIDDYYRTDTHWRQERILDVARRAADTLGAGEFCLFPRRGRQRLRKIKSRIFMASITVRRRFLWTRTRSYISPAK